MIRGYLFLEQKQIMSLSFEMVKALHIITMVLWFSGTFYLVRLFTYYIEAKKKDEPEMIILQRQYSIMMRRLLYMVTWPGLLLLLLFGTWLLVSDPSLLKQPYMHIKLGMVMLLVIYHLINQRIYNRTIKGVINMSAFTLRLWNEVATIFLVTIVFVVVLKTVDWRYGLFGIFLLVVAIWLGIFLRKKFREKDEQELLEKADIELSSKKEDEVKEG